MRRYFFPLLLVCLSLIFACQPASLEAQGNEYGVGVVKDFNIDKNLRVALFQPLEEGTPELNYGAMDAHFVNIDDITYMVDWNDLEDFKNLKQGDKLHYRSSGWQARVEKTGKVFKVVKLNEM